MRTIAFLRFRTVLPAWVLLVSLANAASRIPADHPDDVWFGWPFVFYGNATRFSTELTIYAWPMLLSLAADFMIAAFVIAPVYNRFVPEWLKRHIFNLSVPLALLTVLFFSVLCAEVSPSAGPRDRLELSIFNTFVIGPRHRLNPFV